MRTCLHIRHVVAIAILTALASPSVAKDVDPALAAMIARTSVVVSGRISFVCEFDRVRDDQTFPILTHPEAFAIFTPASWSERNAERSILMLNHDGYYLEYRETKQPDGGITRGIALGPPKALSDRVETNKPPLFAGSFWIPDQRDYVARRLVDCIAKGAGEANGVPTQVYELAVPAADHREAFRFLFPSLKQGGFLRLHVAPQFGGVLPRIELLTPNREVVQSYEAHGFHQVAKGIYWPEVISRIQYHDSDGWSFRYEFRIKVDSINEPIPDDDFVVHLSAGTSVHDATDRAQVTAYTLDKAADSTEIPEISKAIRARQRQ